MNGLDGLGWDKISGGFLANRARLSGSSTVLGPIFLEPSGGTRNRASCGADQIPGEGRAQNVLQNK